MTAPTPRVMMVVRLFAPWVGGTERQAQRLATALAGMGVDVCVATGRWFRGTPGSEIIGGVRVVRNHTLWEFFGIRGLRKLGGYLYMVTLAWLLWRERKRYDIIHVHGLNYHTAVSTLVGRRLGKPVVAKLANSGPDSDIAKMRESQQLAGTRVLLPAALRCDRFVALNTAIVQELSDVGVDRNRIVQIPNGVDDTQALHRDITHPGPLRVVFVGRIHEQKDLPTLVRSVGLIESERPGLVDVRLVGEGPLRDALERQVAAEGLSGRIHFVGASDDVFGYLESSDVFVLPSRAEGLSNALLEAMVAGLPSVASKIPGNVDVIDDGRTGILVAPGDQRALADALTRLADQPDVRRRLGEAARREASERYGLDTIASRYLSLYREMLLHPCITRSHEETA